MRHSFDVKSIMYLLVVLLSWHGAVAENRCGAGWADANSRCGTLCPGGVDNECPSGETCFGQLDACTTSSTENRCGAGWPDANGKCGTNCPGGVDSECPSGEQCFGQLAACGSPTPPTGNTGRCGSGNGPGLQCINAHYSCDNPCSSSSDCSGGGSCQEASATCTDSTPAGTTYSAFNSEQVENARTIIGVGKGYNIPPKGWEVALVTAMQESYILNLGCGDQDSLGLFQQRPVFAWGTVAEIQDPVLSSRAFYGVADHTDNPGLVDIANWEVMTIDAAAQAVQVAEAGNQYAQWIGLAGDIVSNNGDAPALL